MSKHGDHVRVWRTAPSRLIVQSDGDWAGDKSTRKSVSAGNIRSSQHLLRSWSKDQTVIAMSSGKAELYAACMAGSASRRHGTASGCQCGHWNHWQAGIGKQHAMGTENMARELGVHLDAMELQVGANAAIGIIGSQGLGTLKHLGLSNLWLQSAVRGKQVNLKNVQSESNMASLGTKVLDKDEVDRHRKEFGMRTIRPVESRTHSRGRCERTPQNDDETRSTLISISMSNPALCTESVSTRVQPSPSETDRMRVTVQIQVVSQRLICSTRLCQRRIDEHL